MFLKITVDYFFLFFIVHFFLWSIVVLVFACCAPEIRTVHIRKILTGSLMLDIKETPIDHDIQICHVSPTLIRIFIIRNIINATFAVLTEHFAG